MGAFFFGKDENMTVQKLYAKNIYKGNGSNKSFPFTFECPENHPEFVRVFVRENYLNETTNFAIDMQNRIVTYPVDGDALPEGANIIITRELPLTQVMNLINNGPFFAEDIETSLDEIVMMIQQLNEKADRSLTVEVDSTENPNNVIGQIFDARNLTQELAEEAAANAAASLQSEQNAKASETISSRNKTATDENRSSVENTKNQVDALLSQVVEHEANTLGYKNNAMDSAAQASEYEESARASAASANGSASLASQKATEVAGINQQIYIDRDAALAAIDTAKTDAVNKAKAWAEENAGTTPSLIGGAKSSKQWASLAEDRASTATTQANRATTQADRAKDEADRAATEASKVDMSNYYSKTETDNRYLKLSGGDVSGALRTNSSIAKSTNTSELNIFGGQGWNNGGVLTLRGKDNSYLGGSFSIGAYDATSDKLYELVGKNDGSLSWNTEEIERVVSQGDDYIRYANGLQLCWGIAGDSPSGVYYKDITLPAPYLDFNYSIFCENAGNHQGTGLGNTTISYSTRSRDSTTFRVQQNNHIWGFHWFTIGRWK